MSVKTSIMYIEWIEAWCCICFINAQH